MAFNPLKEKGTPLEQQIREWSAIGVKPYDKKSIPHGGAWLRPGIDRSPLKHFASGRRPTARCSFFNRPFKEICF